MPGSPRITIAPPLLSIPSSSDRSRSSSASTEQRPIKADRPTPNMRDGWSQNAGVAALRESEREA